MSSNSERTIRGKDPDSGSQSPLLIGLRDAQRRAAEYEGPALIVLAGPGTGKTRVIVHRVAHLIRDRKVAPERVLACTFSVRAARELRERLARGTNDEAALLEPNQARKVRAQTLHALGAWIVRRFADRLGLPSRTMMVDPAQRRRLVKQVIAREGLFPHAYGEGIDALAARVERAMDVLGERGVLPARAMEFARDQEFSGARAFAAPGEVDDEAVRRTRLVEFSHTARAYEACTRLSRERGWLTFADLMLLPIELLSRDKQAAALVRSDFAHVLVDEFQDNNQGQIELLALLCGVGGGGGNGGNAGNGGKTGPAICVVGDDDQAIYGFRGSDEHAFTRFTRYWPGHDVIELTENFRSTPMVVRATNSIIARAHSRFRPDKQSLSMRREDGHELELVSLGEEKMDGDVIASMLRLAQAGAGSQAWDWGQCAVLVRAHGDAERIAAVLALEGIPWERSRQRTELDEAGVDDVLAWAKWIIDPDDTVAARRAITRPPVIVEPTLATRWELRYRELVRKHAIDPDGIAHPGRYPSYLGALLPTSMDEAQHAALARGLLMHGGLTEKVATMRADEALDLIVQQLDVAHAELLPGPLRARRVRALVTLLKLAKEKQGLLDEPGDLRSFLRYFAELREADPKLESVARSGADAIDSEAQDDDEKEGSGAVGGGGGGGGDGGGDGARGRVQILTAHASKGLEFETVFVARVTAPHGFPKTKENPREDRWTCPPGLIEGPAPVDSETALADEERRIFYVACTRAKSRLVLLARYSGKPSKAAMHFFNELVQTPPDDVRMARLKGEELIKQASQLGLVSQGVDEGAAKGAARVEDVSREFAHRQDIEELVASAQRQARLWAAGALERAASGVGEGAGGAGGARVGAIAKADFEQLMQGLERAARHTAAIATASKGVEVPAWLLGDDVQLSGLVARVQASLADRGKAGAGRGRGAGGELVLRPPGMPLRLSYTSVSDYQRCPRCWYAKHVLRLPEPESKETMVGQATHSALERFYRAWTVADAEGLLRPGLAELLRMGRDCLVQLAGMRSEGLEEQLAQIHAQLRTYFETMHDANAHILEVEWNVSFPITIGARTHEVVAKIDRLDQLPDGGFRVVDYKTGKPWKKLTSPGKDDLQLGMYCLALRAEQGVAEGEGLVGGAEYWCLMSGERGVLRFGDVKLDKVIGQIAEAAEGISGGGFERSERECWGLCGIL